MMMKIKSSLLLMLFFAAIGAKAQTEAYRYQLPLKGVTSNWHSFQLPNAVFTNAQSGLEDLRIYGFKGKDTIEVPYILEKSANQVIEKEINFKIINQSKNQQGFYYTFQADVNTLINQIKLSFKQTNFDWKITLSGSNNNTEWFTILHDYRILSIKNNSTDYQFTQLNFADSKYRYYRISIIANEQPELNAAKILKSDTLKGVDKAVAFQSFNLVNDPKNKESLITVNLSQITPISYIKLNVQSDLDFYRSIKIEYATDSFITDKGQQYNYALLYEGTISSMESPEFRFDSKLTRRLKVTIQNNDNKPLRINAIALKGPIYEIIARFEKTDYAYALYYGNHNAEAPIYELKNFENKIPISLSSLQISEPQNNPRFIVKVTKPLFEHKAWLWSLMGIIILLLGFFAYKMLKE
jgi:hypothetical protein